MIIRRGLLALLLLAGAGWSVHVTVLVATRRVPLAIQLGRGYWISAAALVIGTAVLLTALARTLRPTTPQAGLAPFRLLFSVLVLAAASFLLFLQPFRRLLLDVTLAHAFGLFGLLLLLGPVMRRAPRLFRRLDFLLFNFCLLLVVLEGSLRIAASVKPSPLFAQVDQGVNVRLDSLRRKPGLLRFGFPYNSTGHYDEEFVPGAGGQPLAVMIGDSFSDGVVPHHYHFTTVAERALGGGARIYNMGVPAVGPHEYLYMLRYEALPVRPDVIAVNLFVGNDISQARERRRGDRALRRIFDAQNVLLLTVPRRLAIMREERRALGDRDDEIGAPQGEGAAAGERIETTAELERFFPFLCDWRQEEPTMSWEAFRRVETARAYAECGQEIAHYHALFDILLEMRDAAGTVPFVVVLIPDEFQVEDRLWGAVRESLGSLTVDRGQPQRLLGEWLAEQQIPHIDLLPILRAVPPEEDGDRHLYHQQNTHLNAHGNQVAGEAIAAFLAPFLGE